MGGGAVGGKWWGGCQEVEDRGWSKMTIEVATTGKQDDLANNG